MLESSSIYRSIKLAAQLFGRPLESLTPAELRRVTSVAARQQEIESELGYHLVRCETIRHERQLSFTEARQTIREHLEAQQQALFQKAWIKALRQQAAKQSPDW